VRSGSRWLVASLLAGACGDATGPTRPVVLEVTASDTIQVTGGTLTFTAVARDSGGAAVPDVGITWSVSDGGRGSITSGGVFTAGPGAGPVRVRAAVAEAGLADSVAVRVVVPGTVKWTWAAANVGGKMMNLGGPTLGTDGTVYVLVETGGFPGFPGTVVALAPNGAVGWSVPLAQVSISNGVVVTPGTERLWIAGAQLYLLSTAGEVLWDTIRAVDPDPAVIPDFLGGAASSDLLVAAWGKHVIAYDAADHAFRWVSPLAPYVSWLVPPTITAEGHVLAKLTDDTLFLFHGANGQILRTFQDPDTSVDMRVFGTGTVPVGDRYYMPTWSRLAAHDTAGPLLWLTEATGRGVTEPAVGPDGMLYAQSRSWGLAAIRPDGSLAWTRFRVHPRWSWLGGSALAAGGILYAASENAFWAVSTAGDSLWAYAADSAGTVQAFLGSPAIAPDGTVYTWTETHVYAFWASAPPEPNSPWPMWRHDAQRTGWAR
jgi:hypothetical protein